MKGEEDNGVELYQTGQSIIKTLVYCERLYSSVYDRLPPLLAKIYFAIVRGLVKSPPTAYRNCSEHP